MTARVVATHVWPGDSPVLTVDELVLDWDGIVGDRHYGPTMVAGARQKAVYPRGTLIRNHRQVSLVDLDELRTIARRLGLDEVAPGTIADNICTEGIAELTALPPLTRLRFSSGAVLMTGGENTPCTIAGALVGDRYGTPAARFPKAAWGLRGIVAWVDHPGRIRPGDDIEVLPPSRL